MVYKSSTQVQRFQRDRTVIYTYTVLLMSKAYSSGGPTDHRRHVGAVTSPTLKIPQSRNREFEYYGVCWGSDFLFLHSQETVDST